MFMEMKMEFGTTWPVVDSHMHIGVNATTTFIAEEELIPWMDHGGIDIQFIFQVNQASCHRTPDWNPFIGNDYVAKIQRSHPDRVIGLATVNPWLQPPRGYTFPRDKRGTKFLDVSRNLAIEECERSIGELGLRGLKLHPFLQGCPVNHWTVRNMLDVLCRLQLKIGKPLVLVIHAAGDSIFNTPEALADLAKDYPDLLFLMAHSGYIWGSKNLARLIGPLDNVLFDLTACPEAGTAAEAYDLYGAERFVAGTDGPFAWPNVKNAIVDSIFRDPEERALVLGGNLCRRLDIKF
jgi:predicted TIM-barrel fold metal-dependent hydrolase